MRRSIRPTLPVDLRLTLAPVFRGAGGACARRERDGSWVRATRTPEGPATARFVARRGTIEVEAWGDGAGWVLDAAPDLVGDTDSLEGFNPRTGLVQELHRRMPGLRITRSRGIFEALVPTILAQKVTGAEAARAWRGLVTTYGEPAPGPPFGLRVPPAPSTLAALPYHGFHPFGVEMRRANAIRGVAAEASADRIERLADLPAAEARRRLRALPGIGPWTAAEVAIVALGDADAVSVGDYHLPNTVAWALAGESRGDDERMLELLEPFAGHRGRVTRLIEAAGIAAPRFGPKAPVRSIARW